jgi:hypothetical protein
MSRTQAKLAAAYFERLGVELIIRFTDADANRWQEIRHLELGAFPDRFASMVVCGVAVENVEQWLGLDRGYIGEALGIPGAARLGRQELTGAIKSAIARGRSPDEPVWEVTARVVGNAPGEVFRAWLRADAALHDFYRDCRAAALRGNCPVPNELEGT